MGWEILTNGTAVAVSEDHTFGSDALLLARFALPKKGQRAIDLCAGCGIVGLEWLDTAPPFALTAVEISPEGAALARSAYAAYGGDSTCEAVCGDARQLTLPAAGLYDLIACNPPYFTGGFRAEKDARARARHDDDFPLEEMAAFGARHLRDGGRLTVCHKPEYAAHLIAVLAAHRLEPKRLQTVRNKGKDAPWLVLIEAQKNRKPGLKWLPEQVLEAGAALYGEKALAIRQGR